MPKEYYDIRDGDWARLRQAMRQIMYRLDKLQGYAGDTDIRSDMDMKGAQIKGGPMQYTLSPTDYITRSFLESSQAGESYKKVILKGGTNPILLDNIVGNVVLKPKVIVTQETAPSRPVVPRGELRIYLCPARSGGARYYLVYNSGTNFYYWEASGNGGVDLY